MHWVTIVWSTVAAGCLILALQHVVVWCYRQQDWEHLFFAGTTISVALIAVLELGLMHTVNVWAYGEIMRWVHLPVFTGMACIAGFVWFYFRAGRAWLAFLALGLRFVSLVCNFMADVNLNYLRIDELQQFQLWGETVTLALFEPNPWRRLGELSGVLFVIFVADASWQLWRRGDAVERQRAVLVGGAMVMFLVIGYGQAILIHSGLLHSPYFISLSFSFLIIFMALELSRDVLRAARLTNELQLSEAALRESEQRMELAATAVGLGLWEWQIPQNRIWVTGKSQEIYKVPPQEFFNFEQFMGLVLEQDRPGLTAQIETSLRLGEPFSAEYRLAPEGVQWVLARGRVEFNGDGAPLRMRGVSMDITERKLAEEMALLRQNEITHLSRVTTLGEISGSLAHELNQPLGAILANTEAAELHLGRANPDLEEVRNILADIRKDDMRAGEIIHGMRAFLRHQGLNMEPLAVGELLRDTAKLVSADAASRKTTLSIQAPEGLPPVQADRIHLQQVLVNLMVNGMDAMSHSPLSHRRITLAASSTEGAVQISVIDAGTGIPPAQLDLIFQPFYTSKRGGLGLGLSISQSIIQAHGGTLKVENNLERGATATISLPAHAPILETLSA